MNIETNGAILPEEALRQAAHILQDQLSVFGGLPTIGLEPVAPQPAFGAMQPQAPVELRWPNLSLRLIRSFVVRSNDLELTVRSANCLKAKYYYIAT